MKKDLLFSLEVIYIIVKVIGVTLTIIIQKKSFIVKFIYLI